MTSKRQGWVLSPLGAQRARSRILATGVSGTPFSDSPGALSRASARARPGPLAIIYYLHKDEALKAQGHRLPTSTRTIWEILDRNQRIYRRRPREREPEERPAPGDEWGIDFKDVSSVPAEPGGKKQHVVEIFNIVQGTSISAPLTGLVNDITDTDHPIADGPFGTVSTFNQYLTAGQYMDTSPDPGLGDAQVIGGYTDGGFHNTLAVIEAGALGPGSGRVVLVVTHSLTYLDVCDQVLLLAPGGKTAFCGPPSQIGMALGTTNWADIFSTVAGDPQGANDRYRALAGPQPPPPPMEAPSDFGEPVHTSLRRQFSTIVRRQTRLIISDRGYFIFLALLPFIMGVLSLAVPGTSGFGVPDPMGDAPNEPGQILVLLNVGAIFMGTALTIRDLIGERPIFRREQAVGLSTTAYLLAKVCVYTTFAIVQSAIVTAIVLWGKGAPLGAVALGKPGFELFVDIAATCVASANLGLLLSALAKSNEQIMPLLVVAIMSQLVFSGGMIPVTNRLVLDQLSWVTPARWGFAASASTVDLINLVPGPLTPKDHWWEHRAAVWWFDMAMLAGLSVVYLALVRWTIRLKGGK